MSRPSFFSRTTSSRDQSPLLPQHKSDVSLRALSPISARRSPAASPSPPPSFYRSTANNVSPRPYSPSPSSSRSNPVRRIVQFSAPPPPIAASVILSPSLARLSNLDGASRLPSRRTSTADPLLGLERQERAIQQELQLLLDAQSVGLVHGFGGSANDGASDAGSSTPTASARSERSRGVTPVRQPRRKVVGLRGARRGLGRDMGQLVEVKDEQTLVLENEIRRREEVLGKVKMWEERIHEVWEQLDGYAGNEQQGGGEESAEITELQTEERAVENEIREMEDRLVQMRARKKWIGERIREGTNRRDARLSSYKGALREVESEVRDFLKRPPVETSMVMGSEEGFIALPANRRTLGMANEWWNKEIETLEKRKTDVATERQALKEGQEMWEECVEIVTNFEDDLRVQMKSNAPQEPDMLRKQVDKMTKVVERLEEKVENAEANGWNLLICAIGAELAAFKEGQGLLKGTLEMLDGQNGQQVEKEDSFHSIDDGLGGLKDLSAEAPAVHNQNGGSVDDSEDDGPDLAELLVDKSSNLSDGLD